MRRNLIIILLSLSVVMSEGCDGPLLRYRMRQVYRNVIKLPERVHVVNNGVYEEVSYIDFSLPAMLVFIDSTTCTPCLMSRLLIYEDIIDISKNEKNFQVIILVSSTREDLPLVIKTLQLAEYPFPVFLDIDNHFRQDNPFLPDDGRFHSLFLDTTGRPLLIGDPIDAKVKNLLLNRIQTL